MRMLLLFLFPLLSPLYGEQNLKGCVIQCDATIICSKIWISFEGEQAYLFMLSDTTTWTTNDTESFYKAQNDEWSIGDHLTIKLIENVWIAANADRKSEIVLTPLCHKIPDHITS